VRLFLLPAAMLITALAVACGGGSSADTGDEPETPESTPANTITPTTPIPAPPWATSSPVGESPTAPGTAGGTTLAADTPAVTSTAVPTQPVTQPPATATPTAPPAPTVITVSVRDNSFNPSTITVPAGSTVRWVVEGAAKHDVTGSGFGSGLLGPGDTYEWTFTTPGDYSYSCDIHTIPGTAARMLGRITVQ
jgi:plastocyanin